MSVCVCAGAYGRLFGRGYMCLDACVLAEGFAARQTSVPAPSFCCVIVKLFFVVVMCYEPIYSRELSRTTEAEACRASAIHLHLVNGDSAWAFSDNAWRGLEGVRHVSPCSASCLCSVALLLRCASRRCSGCVGQAMGEESK